MTERTAGPCGLMDKASDFGSEDCRFESCHGREVWFLLPNMVGYNRPLLMFGSLRRAATCIMFNTDSFLYDEMNSYFFRKLCFIGWGARSRGL